MVTITVKITKVLFTRKTVLTHQLLTTMTTTDKPTPRIKEKLIIVPTEHNAITPTQNITIISINDLTKALIDKTTTISIKTHTITINFK